jgi:hypothetical protein
MRSIQRGERARRGIDVEVSEHGKLYFDTAMHLLAAADPVRVS